MRKRLPLALVGVAAAVAATVTGVNSLGAGAAGTTYEFVGWSGGSMVKVLGNKVTANLTAASSIEGPRIGATDTNKLASAKVAGLVDVGAINTSEASRAVPGGVQLESHSQTADVSLLNGLVTIGAVDTKALATVANGNITTDTKTTFVDIHIAGVKLPVTIPKNFGVTIPGVAQVTLNAVYTVKAPDGSAVTTQATGLYISLLKARGNNPLGTQIFLNPSYSAIGLQTPTTKTAVHGYAWATKITADAGNLVNVKTDPTVPISLPGGGTGGVTNANSLATVDLGKLLNVGVITTTATGTNDKTGADARTSVKIAGVNLFNGLIRADALEGVAHVAKSPAGTLTVSTSTNLVNLWIGNHQIPVNVSPNTRINLAGIGYVTINGQGKTPNAGLVRLLDIKLTTEAYGLPVGANIQLGVAAAWITG